MRHSVLLDESGFSAALMDSVVSDIHKNNFIRSQSLGSNDRCSAYTRNNQDQSKPTVDCTRYPIAKEKSTVTVAVP